MSELRRRVLELYRDIDAQVAAAGPVCIASGKCCRFAEYDHTLFLSNLEAAILLESAPPFDPAAVTSATCPFQVGNLCTAREPRPVGCRVYYCDPAYQGRGEEISEDAVRRLKALADEFGVEWRYMPLHRFLTEPGLADIPPFAPGRCGVKKTEEPPAERAATLSLRVLP